MPFVILPTNSISGGYDITNSLRFNSGSSDYLVRTPATTTNRRTWTWSGWVKRATISGTQVLFGHNNYPTLQTSIRFTTDNLLSLAGTGFSGTDESVTSNQVFRDTSAWYHLVVAVDTTQATSSNRVKLYSNGTQITSLLYNAYPTLNLDTAFNFSSAINYIGATNTPTANANLYMAEVNFIDGQQLTPSSFGETDTDTGIWKPKAYTGTYGTNGFYLQFKNSASLGTDSSGNGNTFTVNNLTSIDQTTDTPTNNFATFNALLPPPVTLSNGNLTATTSGTANMSGGTIGVSKGKWYAEFKIGNTPISIGIAPVGFRAELGSSSDSYAYKNSANKYTNGVDTAYGVSYTNGDIISVALDMDNGTLIFYKNGSSQGTAFTSISGTFTFGFGRYTGTEVSCDANFGNPPFTIVSGNADANGYGNFEYTVPSGYYALNTKNLAEYA